MRYPTEPKNKKYVEGYGILLLARQMKDNYGKTLIDTAEKQE